MLEGTLAPLAQVIGGLLAAGGLNAYLMRVGTTPHQRLIGRDREAETMGHTANDTASLRAEIQRRNDEIARLKSEIEKWSARVPKLTATLREREAALEEHAAVIERLASDGSVPSVHGSGIRAREQRIDELENLLAERERSQLDAEGRAHRAAIEIDLLREDLGRWQEKWNGATAALDDNDRALGQRDGHIEALTAEIQAAACEVDRLRAGTASRDSEITDLKSRLREQTDAADRFRSGVEDASAHLAERDTRIATLEAEQARLEDHIEALAASVREHETQSFELEQARAANETLKQTREGISRRAQELEDELDAARTAAGETTVHIERFTEENAALRESLAGHEHDRAALAAELETRQQRLDTLESALAERQHAIDEQTQRTSDFEQHVSDLEAQLREQQPAPPDPAIAARLEERERQLSQHEHNADLHTKTLTVLNQQLEDARAANERLVARVSELEAGAPGSTDVETPPRAPAGLLESPPATVDELCLIRGVGKKLAKRLNALGIYRFAQIAAFEDEDIRWCEQALPGFRGRIQRDDWIGQATALDHPGAGLDAASHEPRPSF